MASRLSEDNVYEPPMLFGLDRLDDYLRRLDTYLKEDIEKHENSRPNSISSEEDFDNDSYIDDHIIDLSETGQILIESALVAYYSYFEKELFSFCKAIEPIHEKLFCLLQEIKRPKSDIDRYLKFVLKHHEIKATNELNKTWRAISNYHLMRNRIVHTFLSEKKSSALLVHIRSTAELWYNPKHGNFSIRIEYVKSFSRLISSFLNELDFLVFQKSGNKTLI